MIFKPLSFPFQMRGRILRLRSAEQSRRDDTLLSGVYISYAGKLCVFASLREIIISRKVAKSQRLQCTDIDREKYMMQVSSLRDFGAHDASLFRRLKSTVNKVLSLRDFSFLFWINPAVLKTIICFLFYNSLKSARNFWSCLKSVELYFLG